MGRRALVADIVDDAALTDPRRIGGTVEHRIIHPFVRHVEDISRRQRVGDQRPADQSGHVAVTARLVVIVVVPLLAFVLVLGPLPPPAFDTVPLADDIPPLSFFRLFLSFFFLSFLSCFSPFLFFFFFFFFF